MHDFFAVLPIDAHIKMRKFGGTYTTEAVSNICFGFNLL